MAEIIAARPRKPVGHHYPDTACHFISNWSSGMRTLPLVVVACALAPLPFRATLRAAPQTARAPGGPTIELADSTSVPMELPDDRAIITVSLNGRGPYRLAVETGSPDVLVSPKVVAELGLPAAGPWQSDSMFRLDSLRIGDALIRSLPVGRDQAFERLGVDGVLGLIAYRDVVLTVDYPNRRVSLSQAHLPTPDGRDVLRAVRVGPFIGIPVDVGGVRETGVIDTQGGVGFAAIPEVADRLAFGTPLRVVGRAVVGGRAPIEVKEGTLSGDVRLGAHLVHQPRIAVHPLPPDIPAHVTIGARVLRNYAISIDQREMVVRLLTPSSFSPVPAPSPSSPARSAPPSASAAPGRASTAAGYWRCCSPRSTG
jgi:hypothetical protein